MGAAEGPGAADLRALRVRCAAKLRGLDVPIPFDLWRFCQAVEARRRRPLLLHPVVSALGPCGLWVATPEADHIFYEQEATPFHQRHIILHELGHVVCDHHPAPVTGADLPQLLFPDLQPSVLHKVLARAGYSNDQEQEAELLASLILEQARAEPPASRDVATEPTARLVGELGAYLAGHTG